MQMYKIALSKQVTKFLKKHKDISKLFYKKIKYISNTPINNSFVDILPLQGLENHYRLRIWKYRFIYEIQKDKILIYFYHVDTRWDVYKNI